MEAIPAMPVTTPNVSESANARDVKSGDADSRCGFGDALKHEMAARSTDGKEAAPAEDAAATDVAVEESEDVAVTDAPVALDPAVAALLGDAALQQPAPVALPAQPVVQQAPIVAAETVAAGQTAAEIAAADAKPDVQRAEAGERFAARGRFERAGVERGNAERGAIERSSVERAAGERGLFERVSTERSALERVPAELRDLHSPRDTDERGLVARDKAGPDAAPSFLTGFTVDRTASAADAPQPVTASTPTLDSLSAATLAAKWAAPSAQEAAAPVATARVDTPLGTPGWGDAFQQKVVWMVDRQLDRAELHLNPPNLGPIDVMLNLSADSAQVAFVSPHAAVREAIEASLSDLRNALEHRGLSLGQATVGTDSGAAREQFAEQAREAARNAQNGRSGGPAVAEAPAPARAPVARRGLVDTFA